MSSFDIIKSPPSALCFDVFGTVVDWRSTVTTRLIQDAARIASSKSSNLAPELKARVSSLTDQDWGRFAQEWRNSYKHFVKSFVPGETEWRDIDTHHHISLIDLLQKWNLDGVYTDSEVKDLSLIWHFLDPWKESSSGIKQLGTKFITSTLSNGNQSLLQDLQSHGDLNFRKLQSSADFKAYKPHPIVYRGAAETMGLETREVAMVAAHLNDLKAARECGMRTIYAERSQEEDWDPNDEEYQRAKSWVDMWVRKDEDGFVEVARRFGI